MDDQNNEDQTNRRKFLKGAGLLGAVAAAPSAAAASAPSQTELSPEQISKLEEIVKNFITNAQDSNVQPPGSTLAKMMNGHGSHNNDAARRRAR